MNAFILASQMGECEANYKILPDLHLKDSNVATIFVPTSTKEERSKFMIKVDEKEDYNGREKKMIEGKKGWFVEKYDLHDKYVRRDRTCRDIDDVSTSQFFKMYVPSHTRKKKKIERQHDSESDNNEEVEVGNDSFDIEEESKFDYVMTATNKKEKIKLPEYIVIDNPFPGEPPFMRKRNKPAVLRFHKPKQSIDAAKYFYSEALLYIPFRAEKEIEDRLRKAAIEGYNDLENEINAVKSQVMEYLESNEEARFMVEEATEKSKVIGKELDPEYEQDIEECENENLFMHPDYEHLNPDELGFTESRAQHEKIYRPIEIDNMEILREKTRNLDFYQRKVIEKGISFSRKIVKSLKDKNPPPKALSLVTQGGAGSGKSTVINILKQWCHLVLQQPGDDPDCPYVIVAAPTGTAAANVRGQTMHSSFGFNFGNEHFSLSDKTRDKKRNLLKNLKIVIIDEFSMIKSDQQFQLDKRLREITQKIEKLFGNVSTFWLGDIMQLKPCLGRYIFEEPINPSFKLDFHLGTHWQSFEVIILEENHRQSEDKVYADMLNRFRVGQQTEEDMQKLQNRVRPLDHPDLDGSMFISCKNKEVEKLNRKRLNEINEETINLVALNVHPTIKNFQPLIGTPFLQTLVLKKRARIQLTYNIDTLDCLTNGARGEVVDVVRNKAGYVEKIMVKFDEHHQGRQKREAQSNLTYLFPGCTPIERIMFQYSIAKKSKNVANTAKVIQFPLSLCFAATAHRFQGQTIYKPNTSANDFRTVFEAAQSYVMLSRVQSLSQLFIIGSLPDNKFYASPKALMELERLLSVSVNMNPPVWEQKHDWSVKIVSLNCQSLVDKIEELREDQMLLISDIICLTETWLKSDSITENIMIPGFDLHLNSVGVGKGIGTYFKSAKCSPEFNIKKQKLQITKISSSEIDVFNIYRSQGADSLELVADLREKISKDKITIVCGDLNLCFIKQRENCVTKMLEDYGFNQLVKEATHIKGGHIDHVYSNHDPGLFQVDVMMYSPYYTSRDHDALFITIRKCQDHQCKVKKNRTIE